MGELPEDVERFIAEHIDSLERLEILLLLRSRRSRELTPAEVTAELRLGPSSAPAQLEALRDRGFVERGGEPPSFRYAPDAPEKERLTSELARCYLDRRVTVIKQIFSPRSDPVRSFADAFDLRRK
jgi:DNA-binding transcriptional ArsR family regulator